MHVYSIKVNMNMLDLTCGDIYIHDLEIVQVYEF